MNTTHGARLVLGTSFVVSMLVAMSCMERFQAMQPDVTAFAMLGLLAGGALLERAIRSAWEGLLSRADAAMAGVMFGLPLGFFFLQNKTATEAGDAAMAQGSVRVVGAVGTVLIVMSAVGAWRRRRQRT
jgi:hypothetical protein